MVRLSVNIDHAATLRNTRSGIDPDPLTAAAFAELGGADGITVHLRDDRRHIRDRDLLLLKQTAQLPINLQMACTEEITNIALGVKPHCCTLVPEGRREVTTEGGLDVLSGFETIKYTVGRLMDKGIRVSLSVDPDPQQIQKALETGAEFIELHTGDYAEAALEHKAGELALLMQAAEFASGMGLRVNAGHGLNYQNTRDIILIKEIEEVHIGHAIMARALFTGLKQAVRDMKILVVSAAGMR